MNYILFDYTDRIPEEYYQKNITTNFGSVVNNQFSDKSDVDFVVDFKPIALNNYADNYFDFKFSLQRILQRPIDLIEQTAIKNPYFEESVNKQRKLVYGL